MTKAEINSGTRADVSSDVADWIKALERENRELRQRQQDLAQGIGAFCDGGAPPTIETMTAFIDVHRKAYGVEPISSVLPIAPPTYYEHVAQRVEATRRSARVSRDAALRLEVHRVFEEKLSNNQP